MRGWVILARQPRFLSTIRIGWRAHLYLLAGVGTRPVESQTRRRLLQSDKGRINNSLKRIPDRRDASLKVTY